MAPASSKEQLVEPAQVVYDKFTKAFLLFGKCHVIYNGNVTTDRGRENFNTLSNPTLELQIKEFLKFYRDSFPRATILPKMHLLEDHMVPWMRRWHLGAGFMGEQGAESIHAHLNRLETTYSGIPNRVDRLLYIYRMYQIETAPSLQSVKPSIKRRAPRKSKRSESHGSPVPGPSPEQHY